MQAQKLLVNSSGLALVVGLVMSNIHMHGRITQLEASQWTESKVLHVLEEVRVQQESENNRQRLVRLQQAYQLAQVSPPNGKRLYGDPNARISMVEFSDVECPYCRKMHANLKQVVDHSEGVINWELKHYPLGGHNPAAAKEAQALECVAELYDNRMAWITLDQMILQTQGYGKGIADLPAFFAALDLDAQKVTSCMDSDDHKGVINWNYQEGRNAGISGTPAIFLEDHKTNERLLVRQYKTSEQLVGIIQQFLAQ